MIQIFNSLTKKKQPFEPIEPGKVKMYVCGMTVYDYCHIGHARPMVIFDVITRYLRSHGYEVIYVHNITDVDDKIINRANENNESCDELTSRFIDFMHEDEKSLMIVSPNHEPRATDYMQQIIELIEKLVAKEHAYLASNGDVYFDVRRFKEYGKLSHRNIDDLISGARVEVTDVKRDPLDFVLWKLEKPNEPSWGSPWGRGRPGWHIECSAMSTEILGQPFDIHGGGMDLKFPHHENEIAQSEAAYNKDFAKIWMHVGLLQINKEKMSKSLDNFFTIREVLKKYHAEVIRYFMISGHYRSTVNYAEENLTQIHNALDSFYLAIRGLPEMQEQDNAEFESRFNAVMDDDFNTPQALAVLFDMMHEINRLRKNNETEKAAQIAFTLKRLASILGILQQDPEAFLRGNIEDSDAQKIEALLIERNKARSEKNWQQADRIRDELTQMGIAIEDTAAGTSWRRE